MSAVRRWRTARKPHDCLDAYQWAHEGRIRPGDRYVEVVVLRSDVIPTPYRGRYCSQCAIGLPDTPDDPKETTR